MKMWLPLVAVVVSWTMCGAYYFEPGFDHYYTYSSKSDMLGLHDVTTIIKFRVRQINETSDGSTLHQLHFDSFVQNSQSGYMIENPMKWNLSEIFLFQISPEGVVDTVHYHPADHHEVLMLKKVLASTLSARKINPDQHEPFTTKEIDHSGHLQHEYKSYRKQDGFVVEKFHQSSERVKRVHKKTLHYDHRGTIRFGIADDTVTLQNDTRQKRQRSAIPGEAPIDDTASGEFPTISTNSRSHVKLTLKRKIESLQNNSFSKEDFIKDTLLIVMTEAPKTGMQEVNETIQNLLKCIQSYEDRYSPNRTQCVSELRNTIMHLKDADYEAFADKEINKTCPENDSKCQNQRTLFIDIFARKGDPFSQDLIIRHFLKNDNASLDHKHRCLLHCIALEKPSKRMVDVMQEICFGKEEELHGSEKLGKTQRRACLTLGAFASVLQHTNNSVANAIAHKLETWIGHHNETHSKPFLARRKRSVSDKDPVRSNHVVTKTVMIHALGNTGMKRSLDHIISYMQPNQGTLEWRRAAIHGLREFSCNESATALVHSIVHDESYIIRAEALEMFRKHPKGNVFTEEQKEIFLSKQYTYPTVMRMKRGLLEASFDNGIHFAIRLPGINWEKTIGTDKLGASFGLIIRNQLELELKPLSGHFMVDEHNEVFAEAHVGLINLEVDIFRAKSCFQGHIGYDINILKDFGINDVQDIVHIFDKMTEKFVTPVKDAIHAFKDIIQTFKDGPGIQELFKRLVSVVKSLPQLLKDVFDKFVKFVVESIEFVGITIFEKIKAIIQHVRDFIEELQDDVLGFYHKVVDVITVQVPMIGKKLMHGVKSLFDSVKIIFTHPMQALSSLGKTILEIKMSIAMFLDVKNQILDACSFLTGKSPFWMNFKDEFMCLLGDLINFKDLFLPMKDGTSKVHSSSTDGIISAMDQRVRIKKYLNDTMNIVMKPLHDLMEIAEPFINTFKSIMKIVMDIKTVYVNIRDTVTSAKAMIQRLFGPKFSIHFPTTRRPPSNQCGKGIWPTTSNRHYNTTGVDVVIAKGNKVKSPVAGIAYRKSHTQVQIIPTDDDFARYEVFLDNVITVGKVSTKGTFIDEGQTLGRASRSPCEPNFIHVALRKKREKESDDYADPSQYLDRIMPIPHWVQECNEHFLRHIGKVFESGELDEDGEQESTEELQRNVGDTMKEFEKIDPAKEPTYQHQMSTRDRITEGFKKGIDNALSRMGNLGNMLKSGKPPSITDLIDLNSLTLNKIRESLRPSSQAILDKLIRTLIQKMKSTSNENPNGLTIPRLRMFIQKGLGKLIGSRQSMMSKLLHRAEKECPMFTGTLARGQGHICTAHKDCQGIHCGIEVKYGSQVKMVDVDITVDSCNHTIQITSTTTRKHTKTVPLNGRNHYVDLAAVFNEVGLNATLIVNGTVTKKHVVVSAAATVCASGFLSCVFPSHVLDDTKFSLSKHCNGPADDHDHSNIMSMSIAEFQNILSLFQMLDKDGLTLFEDIRNFFVDKLFKDPKAVLKMLGVELDNKLDFCFDVDINMGDIDITIIPTVKFTFMVGPIPMGLGFGAGGTIGMDLGLDICLLSLKAEVKVAPKVGGEVMGKIFISLGFAEGGIKLIGYLLQTSFPITAMVTFSKFPLDVTAKMDLYLTPVMFDLRAYAQLNLLFTHVKVFDASIWKYKAPTIHKNIFTTVKKAKDNSAPEFKPNTVNNRKKREGPRGCLLKQIKNRSPTDTAFLIEMSVQDEVSQVKLSYAIGTQKGGTNVADWTEMKGQSLLVPTSSLPNSVPLYWTVRAGNSNGLYAYSHCMLPTFDNTIPDGRVDPSYSYSSHPLKLSGTVVVFDDSQLENQHNTAIGFSPGQYGSEFRQWEPLTLKGTSAREDESSDLRYFSIPKEGKLTSKPFHTMIRGSPLLCAKECLKYTSKCVSFDYEFHSETCDLQEVVQGPKTKLRISGTYKNYERLGIGRTSFIAYDNLNLTHGTMYFMNAEITNVLGYKAYLTSLGTMVDFTPPTTGPLGEGYSEKFLTDGCKASIRQRDRCIDVTWKPNHRFIIDGKGAQSVFNGNKPLEDMLYTISNHYVSANFDGFEDEESGIYGYTWAVGRTVCGIDVVDYNDPHALISSPKYWTYSGYQKDVHLEDGQYYVTVQALNNVVFGGALVTTVCHSTPFTVDTTPPIFGSVNQIMYDEDFDILGIYFTGNDDLSKVARVDFGLGKTKYDVQVRGYSPYPYVDRDDTYIGIEELGLEPGVPAWIRLRLVNNVELFTAGHGDDPILIDRSMPIAGTVLDGSLLKQDLTYQANDKEICAQWIKFFDPESGISQFIWGVGTTPGKDDVVKFRNFTHSQKQSCADVALTHNTTYYSTVVAFNSALNVKNSNSSSDGVLVDITPPLSGWVKDGVEPNRDLQFSADSATKRSNWDNFSDPESEIAKYNVKVTIRNDVDHYEHVQNFEVKDAISFTDHSMPMKHNDFVKFDIEAYNGAGLTVTNHSDGFKVDHTPPEMSFLRDTDSGHRFQSDPTSLLLNWDYRDRESGIKEYRYFVNKISQGMRTKFWPNNSTYATIFPTDPFGITTVHKRLEGLNMESGIKYSIKVTAFNQATMSSSHESEGVIIDTTAPRIEEVRLCKPLEDEELTEDGKRVLHDDPESLTISWRGRDSESGISNIYVGLGTSKGDLSMTGGTFLEFGNEETVVVKNLVLDITSKTNTTYYVALKARNGAGLESDVVYSKKIEVQKANVPGDIYDGREEFMDSDYLFDKTSIAMTFGGFESEACNIVGYEWAVGSQPYFSDILPYTDYGIVLLNDTHGQGQIHLQLYEGSIYYISVRAQTGHGCGEGKDYIVSCSDGIKIDSRAPKVTHIQPSVSDTKTVNHMGAYYQSYVDSLDLTWNISDASPISETYWSVGSLPYESDVKNATLTIENRLPPGEVTLTPGNSVYLNIQSTDDAGNTVFTVSQSVTADITPPNIHGFSCTDFISTSKTMVSCSWDSIKEDESVLDSVYIDLSSDQETPDLATNMTITKGLREWTRDFLLLIRNHTNLDKVYVVIHARNILGLEGVSAFAVTVDRTPPSDAAVDIVTRTDNLEVNDIQQCQIPWMYIEINMHNLFDAESGIDRVEIALGYAPEQSDIRKFAEVDHTRKVFVDHLSLRYGSQVYATARIYNKAGLYTLFSSNPVAISPFPKLTVTDGPVQGNDLDYQSKLNVLQGYWDYSDPCPILKAEWKIEDLTGKVLQDYKQIPGNANFFYNDELTLNNGYMYSVWIRITDGLYRVYETQSDGITVRIQRPNPGTVIDGLTEDRNYQQSTSDLSVSWKGFGNPSSNSPVQKIVKYEVAIGNDRRFAKTRANIHYFIDVGLNQSNIFTNLNLTAKTVTYYMTVRAYSEAGSYEEAVSNGIKVGYRDGVIPGVVETTAFQSDIHTLSSSWSGFESDIGLKTYIVGAGTSPFTYGNDTFNCDDLDLYLHEFDVYNMTNVGLNTFYKMSGLKLLHKELYYIAVVAVDDSNMCAAASGSPILVDTSPPKPPSTQMAINNMKVENVSLFYVTDVSKLTVEWDEFVDEESGISFTDVSLMTFSECPKQSYSSEVLSLVDTLKVLGERKAAFYDLYLSVNQYYIVRLKTVKRAGLMTFRDSRIFSVDTTPPQAGSVHIGPTWEKSASFQYSQTKMLGWTAVVHTEKEYKCLSQRSIINGQTFHSMMDYFDPSQVKKKENNRLEIGIGYNRRRQLVKGGIMSTNVFELRPGNYSVFLKSCKGLNMMSTISFATTYDITPSNFTQPIPKNFHDIEFNISRIENEEELDDDTTTMNSVSNNDNSSTTNFTITDSSSTIENYETTVTASTTTSKETQDNMTYEFTNMGTDSRIGFGVTIIGERQRGARTWDGLFWATDVYKSVEQWFTIENDPSTTLNDFTVVVNSEELPTKTLWNFDLLLNGEVKSQISGLQLDQPLHVIIHAWNKDRYKPPITDIFEFFHTSIDLVDVRVPIEEDKPCLHGSGFYDPDSGIKEIWVGVSDSLNYTENVIPMRKYSDNCMQCKPGCAFGCDPQCKVDDFDIRPLMLHNLQLKSSSIFNQTNATHMLDVSNSSTYYLNVKMVNFAGQESMATSNGIMVDSSPPVCEYLRCTDPTHSIDEPTEYLGSNNTIGAFWSCDEDISQIQKYVIRVGSMEGGNDTFSDTSFGVDTKISFNLNTGKLFQHNKVYYVTLEAINVAGLSSTYSCHMTVQLYPPLINETVVTPMFLSDMSPDSEVYFMEDDDRTGVTWNSKYDDAEFYEWSIGTTETEKEILPKIKVGVSKSGNAAIIKGHLWLNNTNMKKSVSEFVNRNWTGKNLDEVRGDSTFLMEPGRCMHQTLYAEGHSHLASSIVLKPKCIKRPMDIYVSTTKKRIVFEATESGPFNITYQQSTHFLLVNMTTSGSKGGVILGRLNSTDIQRDYGTAASADFNSYIANPSVTKDFTDRTLRHRLIEYKSQSFFISPAPNLEVQELLLEIKPNPVDYDINTSPVLAVWVPEEGAWYDVGEECGYNQTWSGTTLSAKVCLKTLAEKDKPRTKRSTSTMIRLPHQFSLFKANNTYFSTPPVVDIDSVSVEEDTSLIDYVIPWHDKEDDCVQFTMQKTQQQSKATISFDGRLNFTADTDFSGKIFLTIKVTEIVCEGKPPLVTSLSTEKNITVVVEEENDEPDSALIMSDDEVVDPLYNDTVDIFIEANGTGKYTIGSFFLVDVDFNDTLTIVTRTDENQTVANFSVIEVKTISTNLSALARKNINTAKQVKISYDLSPNFSGIVNYTLVGYDSEDFISQPLKIRILALKSPCVHGKCHQKTNTSVPCTSKQRVHSFDPFICKCDAGYEGQWCEIETDECSALPCPILYDCMDYINAYSCNINVGKLVAIVICTVVAIAFAVFLVRKVKPKRKVDHIDDDLTSDFKVENRKRVIPELIKPQQFKAETAGPSDAMKSFKCIKQEVSLPEKPLFLIKPGNLPRINTGNKPMLPIDTRLKAGKCLSEGWNRNEVCNPKDEKKSIGKENRLDNVLIDARSKRQDTYKVNDEDEGTISTKQKKEKFGRSGNHAVDTALDDFMTKMKESIRNDTKVGHWQTGEDHINVSSTRLGSTGNKQASNTPTFNRPRSVDNKSKSKKPNSDMAMDNNAFRMEDGRPEDSKRTQYARTGKQYLSSSCYTVNANSPKPTESPTTMEPRRTTSAALHESFSRPGSSRPSSSASLRSVRPQSVASRELPDVDI